MGLEKYKRCLAAHPTNLNESAGIGPSPWYTLGEHCWYSLADYGWYTVGRHLTPAQLDLGERRDPRATLVVNLANRLDHLAGRLAHLEYPLLTVPRRSAIARYSDPLPMLTASIWPGIKL